MKKFIKVNAICQNKLLILNIDYILEFASVENCNHKSYMRTKTYNMLWLKETTKEIEKLIVKAQK